MDKSYYLIFFYTHIILKILSVIYVFLIDQWKSMCATLTDQKNADSKWLRKMIISFSRVSRNSYWDKWKNF